MTHIHAELPLGPLQATASAHASGATAARAASATRTGSSQQNQAIAAANLVFLADAGFIALGDSQLEKLRNAAGTATPSLPA